MESDLIKYFIFLFSSTILMGGLSLWLKANKKKRNEKKEKKEEN